MRTFSIQETADLTGISSHTLRYYERIDLILNVMRDSNGYRRYSEEDLEWIGFLLRLKGTGMPLEQMRAFADLRRQGPKTAVHRRAILESHRQAVIDHIADLKTSLAMIEGKIQKQKNMEKLHEPT